VRLRPAFLARQKLYLPDNAMACRTHGLPNPFRTCAPHMFTRAIRKHNQKLFPVGTDEVLVPDNSSNPRRSHLQDFVSGEMSVGIMETLK
jgi:hypothetical protein